jgi:hypothetical protein
MSSRKIVIKKLAAPFDGFKVVKVAGPRGADVELIGKVMTPAETKRFIETVGSVTTVEIVE